MTKQLLALLTVAALAACNGDAGRDGDVVAEDTAVTTVTGQDTVDMPTVVPTQDTVIETTTTRVDTVEGGAVTHGDTVRRP